MTTSLSTIAAVTVIVKFDYEARSGDELNLRKGDFISNVQQIASGGWWKGTLEGKTGMFPENFVTVGTSARSAGYFCFIINNIQAFIIVLLYTHTHK